MSIRDYTTEQLQQEIERREGIAAIELPEPLVEIDWTPVIENARESLRAYLSSMAGGDRWGPRVPDRDVLEAIYGPEIEGWFDRVKYLSGEVG